MFDLLGLDMLFNAEQRKVGTYKKGGLFVDTCEVSDSDEPYETAVAHKKYNKGDIVIVEMYDNLKESEKGHKKWVKKMTSKKLPKELKDVSTSHIAKLYNAIRA